MEKYLLFPDFCTKAFTLSYDDDTVYDKRLMEIIDPYGIKCTFNLNSGDFADKEGGRKMTEAQAKEWFCGSPHEIAIHGCGHTHLRDQASDEITHEIFGDRLRLEQLFGCTINGMAYPYDSRDDRVIDIAKNSGILYARTGRSTGRFSLPTDWLRMNPTCHHTSALDLADKFLASVGTEHPWQFGSRLFYVWGHAYEFNDNNNWEIMERLAEKIGGRKDIWYATNGEIYRYVEAYRHLEISADLRVYYNPSCLDVCFAVHQPQWSSIRFFEIKAGQSLTIE